MCTHLGRAALASLLLLGCTSLNPLYADATGGQGESGPGTTMRDATGPNPSSPTDASKTTTPTTPTTLEPTDTSSDSTAVVGPGTNETGTNETGTNETGTSSEESGGSTTGTDPGPCSTYDQDDCPDEQKCMLWASEGAWDALDCFPLVLEPGGPRRGVHGVQNGDIGARRLRRNVDVLGRQSR